MRLPALVLLVAGSAATLPSAAICFASLSATSCSTYRSDLDRARAHYDKNEFEPALALFRVLEPDLDSFEPAQHAQYAYSRGMTDYRLASLVSEGSGVSDPKQAFRSHARHWLAVARAVEKETPGGLTADEKQRLEDALKDLNRDVYGGGDTAADADGGAPPAPPAKAVKASDKP
jgi:hypothetical protein